jgi:transcriptional regulator with XRE-family HTH domain
MKYENKEFKELMEVLDWSIAETCEQLGVSQPTVSLWRNGSTNVNERTLKLMRVYAGFDKEVQYVKNILD